MKTLLIIPAYNEEKNIINTCNKIMEYNKETKEKIDFIVIDDGSTDNTSEICHKNKIPCISLINNLGIGGAVQTGYKYALENNYDIAIQFDGDGQHDVRYVNNIVEDIKKGTADMVIGSRFVGNSSDFKSSKARRVGINIISFFIKLVTGKKIYDTTSGFRAINKQLIAEFASNYPAEYPEPVSTTWVLKKKYIVHEVDVKMHKRENGVSSIRAWKNAYYMFNVILSIIVVGLEENNK